LINVNALSGEYSEKDLRRFGRNSV